MDKDTQIFTILIIVSLIVYFFVIAGLWYVILWSFGFPIMFEWSQVIGVIFIKALFARSSYKKNTKKITVQLDELKKELDKYKVNK